MRIQIWEVLKYINLRSKSFKKGQGLFAIVLIWVIPLIFTVCISLPKLISSVIFSSFHQCRKVASGMVPTIKGKNLIKIDCSAIFGPKISNKIFFQQHVTLFSARSITLCSVNVQFHLTFKIKPNFTIDFEMRTVMSRLFKSRCPPMHLDADFIISDVITQIRWHFINLIPSTTTHHTDAGQTEHLGSDPQVDCCLL